MSYGDDVGWVLAALAVVVGVGKSVACSFDKWQLVHACTLLCMDDDVLTDLPASLAVCNRARKD